MEKQEPPAKTLGQILADAKKKKAEEEALKSKSSGTGNATNAHEKSPPAFNLLANRLKKGITDRLTAKEKELKRMQDMVDGFKDVALKKML